MNPNAPQPNFELPTPLPMPAGEANNDSPEQPAARPETNTQPPALPAAPVPASSPLPQSIPLPPAPAQPAPIQPQPAGSPLTAEDSELIEKEWVIKAKQIVAATREDPHLQNKEMSRFKADYLKKRYNKDIKLEES